MVATYPNKWVCPRRTMSTLWWQPALLTFTKNGASPLRYQSGNSSSKISPDPDKCIACSWFLHILSLSSRCATLSSCHHAGWLLHYLSLCHPLMLLLPTLSSSLCASWFLHRLLSSSHCAALSSCHHAGWLLHRLSLRNPLMLFVVPPSHPFAPADC
jgi:hypothetical protein